ncbi:MAG: capsule biosynthesis protein [Marinibacterium sp.]
MKPTPPNAKVFLFLQGPHGPFFHRLGQMLRAAGAEVLRVGFNAGDRAFWPDRASFVPYDGPAGDWPATLRDLVGRHNVTDIVLYGDTRPIHARAVAVARDRGLTVHVFEEGYLRPYWITYERGGSNGHSRLMQMDLADMRTALSLGDGETPLPPADWGDMRQHMAYGALYHGLVMARRRSFANFRPHRAVPVAQEFRTHLTRLALLPAHSIERRLATRRIRRGGFPYHLALLQLEHDSAFQAHSPFSTMEEFLTEVIDGFAAGAPGHHHLVIKAHPLEDNRVPLRRVAKRLARARGVGERVHYVRGGKLAGLLAEARTAVTINSTAGQQALLRGLPLKVFGDAIYAKPGFVSDQPLAEFFAAPARPDTAGYREFRRFLLETSQVPGGFYSAGGRRQALRHVTDMVLSADDPYDAFLSGTAAPRQQLRLVT